jgi:tRNA (uracil-5-)-methyltransferase
VTCRHFGACGGCATQDLPYPEEVRRKEAALREVLGRDVPVEPSPRDLFYRTRMDYVFAWGKLGLRKRGDPRGVLDLEECLLPSPAAWEAVLRVKEAIHRLGIRPYSYVAKKGYLRYVTVREAPVNGERMLIFLTNGDDPAVGALMDEAEAWVDSVVWSVTDRPADVSVGEVREIRGRGFLEERIGDLKIRFGPNSFFQANPWQTERLYRHLAERAAGNGPVLDLYCGVGGIALAVAQRGGAATGIDDNAEAIAFARGNAAQNGLGQAAFEAADAGRWLQGHGAPATLIVDPPRSGLGFKAIRRLVEAAPERVLYVSCNPKVLAAELAHFRGFEVAELQGFDLFPRTPHVEVVATLTRRAR